MTPDDRQAFVADIARNHGQRLRDFLALKLRRAEHDIPDLLQEIYLRLLRVQHHEAIRSPQAYLYTVAFHVIYQHKLSLATTPDAVDVIDALADAQDLSARDPATILEANQRLAEMEQVLRQLPPKAHAAFILSRHYGYTLDEIAARLKVSRGMVKKYLAKAVAHFRIHLDAKESHL